MLILTRRISESIIIGDGESKSVVTILGVKKNQIRIGIEAPRTISVHREEIYDLIKAEQKQQQFNDLIGSLEGDLV